MTQLNGTTKFTRYTEGQETASAILAHVYSALEAKGYDPITQLTGFILLRDPERGLGAGQPEGRGHHA